MNVPSNTSRNRYTLEPGTLLDGRYEIRRFLGKGGFANVYLAQHIHLDRLCALKILELPQRAEARDQFLQRFTQEARIAVKIKHPNVVDIYDFGVSEEHGPFISMEYLDGNDLEVELEEYGPLDLERAVRLFVPTLDALAQGHLQKIAHKDLKPSNLFLVHPRTPDERLVVLDFGIARLFGEGEIRMTQTGSFSGTPAYLAPEYIEKQLVTPALDVYQMGLIFIEAITGAPAVEGESGMALMIAHCQGAVQIPREVKDTTLGAILRKATQVDPLSRYPEAGEFARDLEALRSFPKMASRPLSARKNRDSADVVSPSTKTDLSASAPPVETIPKRSFVVPTLVFVVLSLLITLAVLVSKRDVSAEPDIVPTVSPSIAVIDPLPVSIEPASEKVISAIIAAKGAVATLPKAAQKDEPAPKASKRTPAKRKREKTTAKTVTPDVSVAPQELPQIAPQPKPVEISSPQPTIID